MSTGVSNINSFVSQLKEKLKANINAIELVNTDIHVLSINAKIEAARTGRAADGFRVVANEVGKMVQRTDTIMKTLENNVTTMVNQFDSMNDIIKGQRLSHSAFTAIDIIDRNLYERSCDVRWWATESALEEALLSPDKLCDNACKRLNTILKSYTVYEDLVLCNSNGVIIANGNSKYSKNIGKNLSGSPWLISAKNTLNAEHFGFETVHNSELVNLPVVAYSCKIHPNGDLNKSAIGYIGILFNWNNLASTVLERLKKTLEEEFNTSVSGYIVTKNSRILASTNPGIRMNSSFDEIIMEDIKRKHSGHFFSLINGLNTGVGFSASEGYETYKSDWYAIFTG